MDHKFAYANEDDKCYGLTGMIISLNVFDNDSMLQMVDIDSEDGDYITFTPDFYFFGNPRFSAKTAWNEMLKQYQMYTALVMGNIMCRYIVGKRQSVTRQMLDDMRGLIDDDGRDICALEDDEIDTVFNKTISYLSRIYGSRQIYQIARAFVDIVKDRRQLSGSEVIDELQHLRRIF